MSLTLRELARHTVTQQFPHIPFSLWQLLRLEQAKRLRLQARSAPFSIMTQNMALFAPIHSPLTDAAYKGTDREGAISEIISTIKDLAPDVVGLCEVWNSGDLERIRKAVAHIYPNFQAGPQKDGNLHADGGLLLLSKHPILEHQQIIYSECAGSDCFADKGIIHIRIHPPSCPMPYDIFYSHTQNIEESGDILGIPFTESGKEVLYKQISCMNEVIKQTANPNNPTLILGDLNIPGEVPEHYNQLIHRLGKPVDLWTVAGNDPASGPTLVKENNFYEDKEDAPDHNQRLDYILMKPGLRFIPILRGIGILKIKHNERFISDHFGLKAGFDRLVQIEFF